MKLQNLKIYKEPHLVISSKDHDYIEARSCGCRFGCYNQITGQVTIFLKDFADKEAYITCQTTPLKQFGTTDKVKQIARTIGHEYLHHILKLEHGYNVSSKLDNIPDKIRLMQF